jgi:hypothetical protein
MSGTWKRVLAATIVLVSAVSVGAYTAKVQSSKPGIQAITVDGDWAGALRRCYALGGETYNSAAGTCITDVLWEAAQQDKMLDASTAVTKYAEENYRFYGLCHRVVHAIGERLFNFYGSIEASITAVNSRDCGTGLAHGVIDFWTLSTPSLEEFRSAIAACELAMGERFGGCAEGLGHATYQHQKPGTPGRLEKAFELCGMFNLEENQEFCAYGVMMQPFLKQNPIITEKEIPVPEWSKHLGVCTNLNVPEGVQRGCYSGGGWIMGVDVTNRFTPKGGGNPDESLLLAIAAEADRGVRACNSEVVREQFRSRCTQEFLARMPISWYADLGRLEERCAALRQRQGDEAGDLCLSGAHEFTPPAEMATLIEKYPRLREILRFKLDNQSADNTAISALGDVQSDTMKADDTPRP